MKKRLGGVPAPVCTADRTPSLHHITRAGLKTVYIMYKSQLFSDISKQLLTPMTLHTHQDIAESYRRVNVRYSHTIWERRPKTCAELGSTKQQLLSWNKICRHQHAWLISDAVEYVVRILQFALPGNVSQQRQYTVGRTGLTVTWHSMVSCLYTVVQKILGLAIFFTYPQQILVNINNFCYRESTQSVQCICRLRILTKWIPAPLIL